MRLHNGKRNLLLYLRSTPKGYEFETIMQIVEFGSYWHGLTQNMGILYTKKAYERLSLAERLSALDSLLKCVQGKPKPQVDM